MNIEDRDGSLFTATAHRTETKTSVEILELPSDILNMTIPILAKKLGISNGAVEKQIAALTEANLLDRVGPAKACHWQVRG